MAVFKQFLICKGVGVLKELDLKVSSLGGCSGLEKLILTLSTLGRWGSLKRTDINSFYFGNV